MALKTKLKLTPKNYDTKQQVYLFVHETKLYSARHFVNNKTMTVIWGPFDWEIWIKFLNIRNSDIQICNKTRKRKTDFDTEKYVFGFSFFLVCLFCWIN